MEQVNIKRESRINDSNFVTMSDFTVRIKNLPTKKTYKNLQMLKAMLVVHFAKILKNEAQVYSKL